MRGRDALQDIYSTVTKQQQVFQQMGFTLSGDPEIAARESVETLFAKGFLSGGHVGSAYEIWMMMVGVIVTAVTLFNPSSVPGRFNRP